MEGSPVGGRSRTLAHGGVLLLYYRPLSELEGSGTTRRPAPASSAARRERPNGSNVDHEYRRAREDWQELCVPCHAIYDRDHLGRFEGKRAA